MNPSGPSAPRSAWTLRVATATAPTLAEATTRAYEAADRIQFEGKNYRRDIGAGGLKPNRV